MQLILGQFILFFRKIVTIAVNIPDPISYKISKLQHYVKHHLQLWCQEKDYV